MQDRHDRRACAAELSWRDLVPAIWLPDPTIRRERELGRFRLHRVRHRMTLKNRIHTTLDLRSSARGLRAVRLAGRELLDRLEIADPWRRNVDVSLAMIDDLELRIARLTVELKQRGADHRDIPLPVTAPGFERINAFTVASGNRRQAASGSRRRYGGAAGRQPSDVAVALRPPGAPCDRA